MGISLKISTLAVLGILSFASTDAIAASSSGIGSSGGGSGTSSTSSSGGGSGTCIVTGTFFYGEVFPNCDTGTCQVTVSKNGMQIASVTQTTNGIAPCQALANQSVNRAVNRFGCMNGGISSGAGTCGQ